MKFPHITGFLVIFMSVILSGISLQSETVSLEKIGVINYKNHDYVSLYDFTRSNSDYYFNIITQRGVIYFKNHRAVFQPGFSVIVIDDSLSKSSYPVIRKNGEILIPVSMFMDILTGFYPGKNYEISNNYIIHKKSNSDTPDIKISEEKIDSYSKEKITFLVIDPGHGGKDPGAVGGKSKEKNITLEVSRRMEKYLTGRLKGVKIVLTRKGDTFPELGTRTEIANKLLSENNNGLFVSIHVNASLSPAVSGFETYFLSQNATNEEARATASMENNVTVLESRKHNASEDADYVEALMITTQIQSESKLLATIIQSEMESELKPFKGRGVKTADFFVLRGVLMPAVLVEIGYITNSKELKYLNSQSYQDMITVSICNGIMAFIKEYNKNFK
ncbi:MAG: N-acetylmuramoyl-L-alanine amidase [Spirochaetes bacterium]|nr:N-acetylmuramoyl-L-alanine amidase [Spirochaetota bacterium]